MLLRILALTILIGAAGNLGPAFAQKHQDRGVAARARQVEILDHDDFRVEDLELDVFDLATASDLKSPDALRQLPAPDSPLGAVLRLAHAYALGRVEEYGKLLTLDFRYTFAEAELQEKHPDGFGREDEIASLDHLVHGFVDRAGVARPRARSMRLRFDRIEAGEDPEFPEDPIRRARVRVRAQLEITLATGQVLGALAGIQEFHLVRGDLASTNDSRNADHWYVWKWSEREIEEEAVTAAPDAEAEEPVRSAETPGRGSSAEARQEEPAGRVPQQEPLRFSLAVLGAPARGTLRALVTLADEGEAHLDLFDVSGRRVIEHPLGHRSPGKFEVQLTSRGELPSGVYWMRLRQGPRTVVTRAQLLR